MTADQLPLPVARATNPGTSWAAAKSLTRGRTEQAILDLFTHDGVELTDDEITTRLPAMYPPTVKSARSRLTNAGLLADADVRRRSSRGRLMIVWRRPDPERLKRLLGELRGALA